ncbi:nuclear factor of activated T-cells, cytoplasmic 1-like isoform X1 [Alosa sapidissima]|uniref:nuclear factor of activated T-cells, cytoplasmic 1-like isoform X1 n=2 Tax=Alosa sapidissima TaxID=34773 RepID=UPI001C08F48A|nr:nuclear factor of activated T-cells, cytoplasmic 1-like isoform X1 [Alosa sapidissima]
MQDTICLRVNSRFNFGPRFPPARGKEYGLNFPSTITTIMKSAEEEAFNYTPNVSLSLPLSMGNPYLANQYHNLQTSPVISVTSCQQSGYSMHEDAVASGYYLRPNGAPPLESPRIEITAYGQFADDEVEESGTADPAMAKQRNVVNSVVTLTLPNADGYRDPSCLSPASSLSSRSCNSEASSYEYYNYDASPQNSPWQSPCVSPKGSSSLLSCPHAITMATGLIGGGSASSPTRHSPSNSPHTGLANDDGWGNGNGNGNGAPRNGGGSGSSRPNSPSCGATAGKRKYSLNGAPYRQPSYSPNQSPVPSPHGSPRLSVTDDNWMASNTNQYTNSAIVAAINALTTDGVVDLAEGIPIKSRKTTVEHGPGMSLKVEPREDELGPGGGGDLCQEDYNSTTAATTRLPFKKESYCTGFLDVPPHPYSWSKPKPYLSPSLPALDWQLPSCSGPYSLQIEVQPKSHHRAHYETEGSRGAVKALSGGHPVVQLYGYMESEPLTLQLFIGTADDRLLRPHAFYQVHRITGKTVSTASHEVHQNNTKVLEIPLLPENNMRAIIDCAGILKLRNSDIELRKGETDIGRKNTRVRMVFRVHINQPNGRTVSLQAASNPIECSQRSAQELPLVEKQSLDSYPATGGKRVLLSGHNFLPDSKVVFVEKAQDGHHLWETEAKVDKDSIKSCSLVVEIPPYRNQRISSPVQVNFYVCNGKRKRSQYQRFTYLPPNVPMIKTEPSDDYESQGPPVMSMHSKSYYGQQRLTPMMPLGEVDGCLVSGYPSCPQRHSAVPASSSPSSPPSSSPKLHDLSPVVAYPKCLPSSPTHHPLPLQETAGRGGSLGLPASPDHHPSLALLHSTQGSSPHLTSPGYNPPPHPLYPNSSPSSSPVSHPSTPGAASAESPFVPSFSPGQTPPAGAQTQGSPADSPPSVTVKQEPQELDQMYLDDVNEIIRNDLSSISVHSHA